MAYPANGQDTLWINDDFRSAEVIDFGYIRNDSLPRDDFDMMRYGEGIPFLPMHQTGVSFPPAEKIYWVKFTVRNIDRKEQPLLLEVANPYINELRLYLQRQDGTIFSSMTTGDKLPFAQREIRHRHFIFEFSIPEGESMTAFLYADKYGESISIPATLYRQSAFIEFQQKEMLMLFGYFGFMFTFIFGAAIATVLLRERTYLYFLLYILFSTLSQFSVSGLGYQYLWPSSPYFAHISGYFFSWAGIIAMLSMTRAFFHTGKRFPRFDRWIKILMAIIIAFLPVLLLNTWISPRHLSYIIPVGHVAIISYCIVLIAVPIAVFRIKKKPEALWFILAFLFSVAGITIHNLEIFDVLDYNWLTRHAIKSGLALDIFTLSIVMAFQIRQTQHRNRQMASSIQGLKIEAANALLEGQQTERSRLSQELHDGASLLLATLRMRLSNLQHRLPGQEEQQLFAPILQDMGRVSEDIRRFSHALAPVNFNETSLKDALEDLAYQVREASAGLIVQSHIAVSEDSLISDFAKQTIYQTAQELLTNVLKYSKATAVSISLSIIGGECTLTVTDNGAGFEPINHPGDGIGLKNIRARAILLNGKVLIDSQTGKGTTVLFSFPITEKNLFIS